MQFIKRIKFDYIFFKENSWKTLRKAQTAQCKNWQKNTNSDIMEQKIPKTKKCMQKYLIYYLSGKF